MDAETIRLIVVASGAVLAGASSALIAGGFGRASTLRTLAAARRADAQQALRDKHFEHMRWHRDQKLVAYQAFLAAAEKGAANWDSVAHSPDPASLRAARGQVKVLGTVGVRRAAAEVTYAYVRLRDSVENKVAKGNITARNILLEELGKSIDAYIDAVRSDLGTTTEEDAAFKDSAADRWAKLSLPRSLDLDRFGGGHDGEH